MKNIFDRKFGKAFIDTVPRSPGIYQMFDAAGLVIYVGKAKILKRRLQQYRNARRCKRHAKMRQILKHAESVQITLCENDLDALLLENKLIQSLRPRFNIAGAFSFLYPVIAVRHVESTLTIAYSTTPEPLSQFRLYGAYRSRYITREAYFGLVSLLEHLGHREPSSKLKDEPKIPFSYLSKYRQINSNWVTALEKFLTGTSTNFLELAVLSLLEKAQARRDAEHIQESINALKRFYKFEAKSLNEAFRLVNQSPGFIDQKNRDALFLRSREVSRSTHLNNIS